MLNLRKKSSYYLVILFSIFSISATIVTFIAAIFIIQDYFQHQTITELAESDPTVILAEVDKIKKTLEGVEQLSVQVEALGNAAIDAQKKADESQLLINLSEDEIKALERRLNPANGVYLNIAIGIIMLFVGYFLNKWLDRMMIRFSYVKKPDDQKM